MKGKHVLCGAMMLIGHNAAHALNPVNGFYGGVFLGVSYADSSNFTFTPPVTIAGTNGSISADSGKLPRSVLGEVGGQIGYRFCDRFRFEVEYLYDNNPFSSLTLNNVTITSPYYTLTPPNSIKFDNVENSANAHIQGDVNMGAVMANFLFDIFTSGQDGYSSVLPFVGGGLGMSYVQNSLQFYSPSITTANSTTIPSREIFSALQTRTTWAAQGIVGVHYFLDDFTWFSLDLRYFQTGSSDPKTEYTFITPTAVYSTHSSVNIFGSSTQLISFNISFNGAFNFG